MEEFNGKILNDSEKLEIAFQEQDWTNFENLLKCGANPKLVYNTAKTMSNGRLSICQCDMLKLIDKYTIKEIFWVVVESSRP